MLSEFGQIEKGHFHSGSDGNTSACSKARRKENTTPAII
nr:MAG TPA: hypothetical protein [Caudoviricetes sp.]DAM21393.1 MAG TPA: hypothetical protein [Caudoviricetes sp.]DAY49995.1 MAG TPA: hypothetical protein [Caudoviricetes sp.]DAY61806.1 MAG TPA: hypothetical protein [Caudoviricetes sp.]